MIDCWPRPGQWGCRPRRPPDRAFRRFWRQACLSPVVHRLSWRETRVSQPGRCNDSARPVFNHSMRIRPTVAFALVLVACSQAQLAAAVPSAVATNQVPASSAASASPTPSLAPGDLPVSSVDFSCRLPVVTRGNDGSGVTLQGGFIRFPSGQLTHDPNGIIQSRYPENDTATTATPILYGAGGAFYDRAAKRWVPALPPQSTADGSAVRVRDPCFAGECGERGVGWCSKLRPTFAGPAGGRGLWSARRVPRISFCIGRPKRGRLAAGSWQRVGHPAARGASGVGRARRQGVGRSPRSSRQDGVARDGDCPGR